MSTVRIVVMGAFLNGKASIEVENSFIIFSMNSFSIDVGTTMSLKSMKLTLSQ